MTLLQKVTCEAGDEQTSRWQERGGGADAVKSDGNDDSKAL